MRYAEGVPGRTLSRVGPGTQTPGSVCCGPCCVHAVGFVGVACVLLLFLCIVLSFVFVCLYVCVL